MLFNFFLPCFNLCLFSNLTILPLRLSTVCVMRKLELCLLEPTNKRTASTSESESYHLDSIICYNSKSATSVTIFGYCQPFLDYLVKLTFIHSTVPSEGSDTYGI